MIAVNYYQAGDLYMFDSDSQLVRDAVGGRADTLNTLLFLNFLNSLNSLNPP